MDYTLSVVASKALWDHSSIGLEHRPVTAEVAGSSPVGLGKEFLNRKIEIKTYLNFYEKKNYLLLGPFTFPLWIAREK
jgi:hypothetical protein